MEEKDTKVKTEKSKKKTLIITLISVFVALIIVCTTLILIFANRGKDVNTINLFSKNLVAVKLEDGWGYANPKGEIVIKGQFGDANSFTDNGLALVALDGYYGYINTKGQFVINPIYNQAKSFDDNGFAVVKRNSKYGYVNERGEEIIPCQFDEAHSFSQNFALVRVGSKYGFINEKGKFVINPMFDYAESFVNKKLTVVGELKNSKLTYACLSKDGELITDFMFTKIHVSDKYVIIYDGVYYSLCGLDLNPLFKTRYQIADFPIELDSFKNIDNNLIPFRDSETYKYGYLNKKGQVVIDAKYDIVGNFYDDRALVKIDNKYGFIDTNGRLIVNNVYDIVRNYHNNYAVVGVIVDGNMAYGLININGNEALQTKYYALGDVNKDICYFTTFDSELFGYINVKGEVIIPQIYSANGRHIEAYDFTNDGYVVVKQDSVYGVMNTKGEFIINPYLLDVNY